MISEKKLDDRLGKEIKKMDGLYLKLLSIMFSGFPDRTILLRPGRVYFVELKSEGKKPRALQVVARKALERLGFEVFIIDSEETLNSFLTHIKTK